MKKKVLLLIALLLPLMACAQVTKIKEEADTLNEKAYKYAYQGNFEAAIATIDLNSISTPYILCSKYILKKAGCFFYKKKETAYSSEI